MKLNTQNLTAILAQKTNIKNIILFRFLYFFIIGINYIFVDYGVLIENKKDILNPYFWLYYDMGGIPAFQIYKWIFIVSLWSVALGLSVRIFAITALIFSWLYIAPIQFHFPSNDKNLLFFHLLVMLFYSYKGKSIASLFKSLNDASDIAPLKLIQFTVGLAYLSAGLSKLINGGFRWLDGQTLQSYMAEWWIYSYSPLVEILLQWPQVISLFSVAGVLFELCFIFCVFVNREQVRYFIFCGLLFHMGTHVLMGPGLNFYLFFLPAYLAFWQPYKLKA